MPFTLVGHRGAMGLEPENTLRSFRRAVTEGADAIELDVRLSADGHLVILHDADVQRTTNGSGKVAEMSLREIKALDAGLGETIPTLEEVVDVIDLPMQIEIKAPEATPATLQLIRERRLRDHITVTSFSAEVVRATREQAPDVRTGLISSKARPETVEQARELGASVVCLGLGELSATIVERCHTEHLEIIGWPANTADDLVAALRLGIDGATSNYPALLRDVTRERPEVSELLR